MCKLGLGGSFVIIALIVFAAVSIWSLFLVHGSLNEKRPAPMGLCIRMLGIVPLHQLVALFWEVNKPLGITFFLEEEWPWGCRLKIIALPHFLPFLSASCVDKNVLDQLSAPTAIQK